MKLNISGNYGRDNGVYKSNILINKESQFIMNNDYDYLILDIITYNDTLKNHRNNNFVSYIHFLINNKRYRLTIESTKFLLPTSNEISHNHYNEPNYYNHFYCIINEKVKKDDIIKLNMWLSNQPHIIRNVEGYIKLQKHQTSLISGTFERSESGEYITNILLDNSITKQQCDTVTLDVTIKNESGRDNTYNSIYLNNEKIILYHHNDSLELEKKYTIELPINTYENQAILIRGYISNQHNIKKSISGTIKFISNYEESVYNQSIMDFLLQINNDWSQSYYKYFEINIYKNNIICDTFSLSHQYYFDISDKQETDKDGSNTLSICFTYNYVIFIKNNIRSELWNRISKEHKKFDIKLTTLINDNVDIISLNNNEFLKDVGLSMSLYLIQNIKVSTLQDGCITKILYFIHKTYLIHNHDIFQNRIISALNVIINSQHQNGGWSLYTEKKGYYSDYLAYNDGVHINAISILYKILYEEKEDFGYLSEELINNIQIAYDKALDFILNTQIIVNNEKKIWAQQYYPDTLLPAPARSFEPNGLCGLESVGIIKFLKNIKNPTNEILDCIEYATEWFDNNYINTPLYRYNNNFYEGNGLYSKQWARYYDINTNAPIYLDRDTNIYTDIVELNEISESKRALGYNWYNNLYNYL